MNYYCSIGPPQTHVTNFGTVGRARGPKSSLEYSETKANVWLISSFDVFEKIILTLLTFKNLPITFSEIFFKMLNFDLFRCMQSGRLRRIRLKSAFKFEQSYRLPTSVYLFIFVFFLYKFK